MCDLHAASHISELIVQPLLQLLQLSRMQLLEFGCPISPKLACDRQHLLMSPSLLSQQGLLFTYALSILVSHLLGSSRELLIASFQLPLILSDPSKVACCLYFHQLSAVLLLFPELFSHLNLPHQLIPLMYQERLMFPSFLPLAFAFCLVGTQLIRVAVVHQLVPLISHPLHLSHPASVHRYVRRHRGK